MRRHAARRPSSAGTRATRACTPGSCSIALDDALVELPALRLRVAEEVDVERRRDQSARGEPGSIACADCRLRTKSPAAISSSSGAPPPRRPAPSSARRRRARRRRIASSLSAVTRPGRETPAAPVRRRTAGRSAATARARTAAPPVDGEVERDRQRAGRRRRRPERLDDAPREAQAGRTADDASSTLSVSSCRTMRQRLAPSARRIAISRRRAAALREQQVGDVRAGDQQHRADDAAEQRRHRSHLLPLAADRRRRSAHGPTIRWRRCRSGCASATNVGGQRRRARPGLLAP